MDEHVAIINATGELRRAIEHGEDDASIGSHVDEVAHLLGPHTGAEEVGLFTVMKRQDDFAEYVTRLCGEHVTLDGLLAAIGDGRRDLVGVFEDALRDHIDREDNSLFPAAAVSLSGEDWTQVDDLTHRHDHEHGIVHAHH